MKIEEIIKTIPHQFGIRRTSKASYRKPRLTVLGDVRTLTLGGSPGAGESHGASARKRKVH